MLVMGLMSGTSADGIDVALARVKEEVPGGECRVASDEKRNPGPTLAGRGWGTHEEKPPGAIPAREAPATRTKRELVGHMTLGMNAAVRNVFWRVGVGGACWAGEISQLNFRVGEEFAAAAIAACMNFRVARERVGLIGSHGQTIFHQGNAVAFLGRKTASTLQIGEPSVIAARTGIPTVGDFRVADMAAGGQGAPLVPYVDWLLLRDERVGRVALNLGGIGNVTVLEASSEIKVEGSKVRRRGGGRFNTGRTGGRTPFGYAQGRQGSQRRGRGRGEKREEVMAFDTGPGNMVIDALVAHFTNGKTRFDRDARMARAGRCINSLLEELMRDPYLALAPPKSTGREYYGREFVGRLLEKARKYHVRPEDIVRTVTVFTALSVVDALNRFVLPRVEIGQVVVSGGGARNPLILAQLSAALAPIEVVTSTSVGVPEDAKEAYAFALLAYETWMGRTGNLPSATGAGRAVILGKICWP